MPGLGLDDSHLSLLCDPDTRYAFEQDGPTLRNVATGRVYPVRDDIPLFISSLSGPNLRAQTLYDRIAPVYDLAIGLLGLLGLRSDPRPAFLAPLILTPGARVLEVGIGTGANLPFLPVDIDLYGVDISWRMLHRCQKKLRKLGRSAHLYQAEACRLPFRAAVFDVVIHTLGIHGFNSPTRAIREMTWVARPGAQILIVDKHRRKARSGTAAAQAASNSIVEWIPEEMEDVQVSTLDRGAFECVTFRIPREAPQPD